MSAETGEIPKIDLHMHSIISDGSDKPEELIALVRERGIGLFALTDHDAAAGCARIREALRPGDPQFLTGVEFSCKDKCGKYHILGYGFDPESPSILETVEKGHSLRMENVRGRIRLLKKEHGFVFPQEEINKLLNLPNPGKPHIANLMVKCGYAADRTQAIREYINKLSYETLYLEPWEAITGILGGGGIPVLAHPAYGSGNESIRGEEMDRRLCCLIECGLKGVEAVYSGFSQEILEETLCFTEKYKLYVTAGSDYHGKNKTVRLGDTGFDRIEKVPEGLRRFLEDVSGKLIQAGE